jgi:hypothetical protein
MKTTRADQAADALFAAMVDYRTALAASAEDPHAVDVAEAALKAAIDSSGEVLPDFEALSAVILCSTSGYAKWPALRE